MRSEEPDASMSGGKAITGAITIEELVSGYPASVPFLIARGLPCLVCGEPAWGTLAELTSKHGLTGAETESLVEAMNAAIGGREER